MSTFAIILLVLLLGIGAWVIVTYNFFVSAKARIKAAVQEIGNQLKRQADLIPNLESSAKGYLAHEKDIFEKLVNSPEYQRIKALANLRTSLYFGVITTEFNKLPKDGYYKILWALRKDEEIVVYCSDDACYASRAAADFLERTGYEKVSHYPGGLHDWSAAGYPLEGSMVSGPVR